MDVRSHWEKMYSNEAPESVSWYRAHLETSLALIERAAAFEIQLRLTGKWAASHAAMPPAISLTESNPLRCNKLAAIEDR